MSYIVLDDASDTTTAVKNARKLTVEDGVDVIIGSTTSPASLAMVDVAAETKTPMISMAASARIVGADGRQEALGLQTPQNDQQMASAIVEHMVANNVKKVSFIGYANAYGEGWYEQFKKLAEAKGIERRQRALPTRPIPR